MGKKKKTTTGPSKYSKPHIDRALAATNATYQNNQGNLQGISNDLRGVMGSAIGRWNDQAGLDAADGYNQGVLGGDRFNSNPHLEQMIINTGDSVSDRVNSIFSKAGRTGSGAHGEGLGRGLAEAENQLRYADYGQERAAQEAAASRAAQLEAARYAGLGAINGTGVNAAQLPYVGANALAQNTQGLVGNYTTTTQKQGLGNTLGGLIGTGLSAWAGGGFPKIGG